MFSFFKGKKSDEIVLYAPVNGQVIDLAEVKDPTFAEKMLGDGIAILPADGNIVSPVDGTVSLVFDTLHALSITSQDGTEILIHVGLETVGMNGNGFQSFVNTGDTVKKGDSLLKVDLDAVKAAGCDTVIPIVICNTDDYESVMAEKVDAVKSGDALLRIIKK